MDREENNQLPDEDEDQNERTPTIRSAHGKIMVKEINEWKISYSQSNRSIYINITLHHAFKMRLPLDTLKEMIEGLDEHMEEEDDADTIPGTP